MSTVPVKKLPEPDESKSPLIRNINKLCREVEERAFDLFRSRGFQGGHELDDWLQAERELLGAPPAELVNREKAIELRIALPGFEAKDVEVTALPEEIIVHAALSHEEAKTEEGVEWSELQKKEVYRRIALPDMILLDTAQSELKLGILTVKADKAAPGQSKRITVAA